MVGAQQMPGLMTSFGLGTAFLTARPWRGLPPTFLGVELPMKALDDVSVNLVACQFPFGERDAFLTMDIAKKFNAEMIQILPAKGGVGLVVSAIIFERMVIVVNLAVVLRGCFKIIELMFSIA
jgi:hypothetical protein